jgi:hypothetical protein
VTEIKPIGNHTYQRLTNEEAVAKYGRSLVFVGTPQAKRLPKEAPKLTAKKSKQRPQ